MSAVISEQRIQGLEHWTREQIKKAVREYIRDIVSESGVDFKIVDMEIVGSRTRGTATPESDLDVVVQYTGELKEDRAQDIFNIERLRLDSIEVDIIPIREPLKKWLERHKGYVKMHYDDVPFPEVIEEIKKVPDVNDPKRINYWVQRGDKIIYIEGWCDKCLLGTGFPPMEKGGTFEKVMYMEDMTLKILEAKAKEKGLRLLRGGFAETEDKENLYGVTWGVFEAAKAAQGILTINYTDYRGAGVSKTLPPDHAVIERVLNEMRREATLRIDGKIIGKVEYLGRAGLPHGRRWNWWYDTEEVDKLGAEQQSCMYLSDNVRLAYIRKAVETEDLNVKPSDFTQENDFVVVKKRGNVLHYYERWLESCWSALLKKPQYKGMPRKQAIDLYMKERFGEIARMSGYRILRYSYSGGILFAEMEKLKAEMVKESNMNAEKTVYIAGMPEAVKDNRARMQELGNMLREGGYGVTGRQADIKELPYLEYKAYSEDDFKNVAEWFKKNISELSFEFKHENIDKFKKQITEMLRPTVEDRDRIELIIEELKEGKPPYAIFVDKTDNFILEGRHRIIAFYLYGLKKIPVYYVSLKASMPEATKDNKRLQKEPWQMTYSEFFGIAGSEYTSGERFGIPTKNRVPIIPETGFGEKGATPEERVHRAVVRKALREKKPVPQEVLAEYPDLARIYGKTGNHLPPVKEPWQMTKEEFKKTASPLQNREDFIKAWLRDNEHIPNKVKQGINQIPQRDGALLVYGNEKGEPVSVLSFRKDAVDAIAVSDRYTHRGIATQLLEESRKYGVRRTEGTISPEFAGIAHRFAVKTAFLEGKPIPPEVLREYPDLMGKAEKQKWRMA
ncbi:MAG: nucleotidyltransferase domain-containing protein [Nitrospirota bacterium]|nr:nucleotidyltransferase domain-containing protein [Nitrospirota bacterium]